MENTHDISFNLTVSAEVGEYGSFIRIKRDRRWMCLSASLWMIIPKNLQKLRNNGYVLHLTKVKRLEVDKLYVSFLQISYHKDKEYKCYINFNDDGWATLLDKMPKINSKLFGEEECKECFGIKTPIYLEMINK